MKTIIGYPAPLMSLYQAWDLVQDSEIDADTASAVAKLITLMYMYQGEAPELRRLAAGQPVAADALTGEITRLMSSEDLAERPRNLLTALSRWVKHVVSKSEHSDRELSVLADSPGSSAAAHR